MATIDELAKKHGFKWPLGSKRLERDEIAEAVQAATRAKNSLEKLEDVATHIRAEYAGHYDAAYKALTYQLAIHGGIMDDECVRLIFEDMHPDLLRPTSLRR